MIKMPSPNKCRNKSDLGDDFIAPDGGWGWLICVAGGISILTSLPIWQSFGLIFRDRFSELDLTTSQITTIINIQPAVTSLLGLFTGPIFRFCTYRQVSLISAISVTTGILLASMSDSFLTIIISISIIFGAGMGLGLTSTFITINTYFQEKRRTARSVALCISGCGAIVMPHLANIVLQHYGFTDSLIIFAAISMNGFVCALLYQPVQWHTKNSINVHNKNEYEIPERHQIESNTIEVELSRESLFQPVEIQSVPIEKQEPTKKFTCLQNIVQFFDLDLLKDFTYLNLIIGLALTQFSEQNFAMLTPFFLADYKFTDTQIATAMSLQGVGDLLTRFLIPCFTVKLNWSSRIYFIIGIFGLTIGRVLVTQVQSFEVLLAVFAFLGSCKAFRTIFMGLVIPDHVPLKRLPPATGLKNFTSGIFTISCGPIVGKIRDVFNSTVMLYSLSLCSLTMIIMWTLEIVLISFFKNPKTNKILNK